MQYAFFFSFVFRLTSSSILLSRLIRLYLQSVSTHVLTSCRLDQLNWAARINAFGCNGYYIVALTIYEIAKKNTITTETQRACVFYNHHHQPYHQPVTRAIVENTSLQYAVYWDQCSNQLFELVEKRRSTAMQHSQFSNGFNEIDTRIYEWLDRIDNNRCGYCIQRHSQCTITRCGQGGADRPNSEYAMDAVLFQTNRLPYVYTVYAFALGGPFVLCFILRSVPTGPRMAHSFQSFSVLVVYFL